MPREFSRKLRVAAELKRLLNELLYTEVKDPRLAGVTISEVELSGDLGAAKVYFTTLDPDQDPAAVEAAFSKATGFMRSRIGHALRLRRVPELHFVHDVSARRGAELSRLIDTATRGLPERPAGPEGGQGNGAGEGGPGNGAGESAE